MRRVQVHKDPTCGEGKYALSIDGRGLDHRQREALDSLAEYCTPCLGPIAGQVGALAKLGLADVTASDITTVIGGLLQCRELER